MKPATRAAAQELIARLAEAGFAHVEPAILQPAEAFLDLSGEDLRRRMYLTSDAEGRELCLRPDLTIPTALMHLARGDAGAAAYCYLGPVFRYRSNGADEFHQAGMEIFGREDHEAADAEVVARATEALGAFGVTGTVLRLGDIGLISALFDALALPTAWRRRLARDAARDGGLKAVPKSLREGGSAPAEHTAFLAALEGSDPKAARAVVEDLLAIAGIKEVGGRTAGEIAERFLEQARLSVEAELPQATRQILAEFLAIAGTPPQVAEAVRGLAHRHGLLGRADGALERAVAALERRTSLMAGHGLDVSAMECAAGFGRRLDYYSGLVFELHAPHRPDLAPLVGGGRYDGLLTMLGSPKPVPAVGCAIWIERLEEAAR